MLREKERVDLVIVVMHMGLEVDLRTGERFPGQMPNENAAFAIAENVPGTDVILVEVTGKQLKEALEHSARHFGTYKPNTPLSELTDERFPSYTYDVAEGITYDLDISKPAGERIQNIRFRGQPVTSAQKLRLATITFRVNAAPATRCSKMRGSFTDQAKSYES